MKTMKYFQNTNFGGRKKTRKLEECISQYMLYFYFKQVKNK